MRTIGGFCIALLLAGGGFAQNHAGSVQPVLVGGFGNVVHPGGTPATVPGLQRTTPNVVFPGGGGPRLVVPNPNGRQHRGNGNFGGNNAAAYAYPVYIGGYGYGYDPSYAAPPAPAEPQQPNVTVVYPPQPAPVIINQFGPADPAAAPRPRMYEMPREPEADTAPAPVEPTHFLMAFKDHTIYSAIAYWVDGDTLHYFTAGNTHNQASLSLVDRELTERLNRESGVQVKLPPAK
jgi:hypothetical protein